MDVEIPAYSNVYVAGSPIFPMVQNIHQYPFRAMQRGDIIYTTIAFITVIMCVLSGGCGIPAAASAGFEPASEPQVPDINLRTDTSSTGTTYYIAPSGLDTNSGTSDLNPWKTFDFALPKLNPGDTLLLMDGTYTKNTTGLISIDASTTGQEKDGTRNAPITIKAQTERKALLQTDGSTIPFAMHGASYWIVDGLYANSTGTGGAEKYSFAVQYTYETIFRHLLGVHTYSNSPISAVYAMVHVENFTIEDSEAYDFHSVGFNAYSSVNITVRRCYANSRCHGGWEGITMNGTYGGITENSISEGNCGIQIHGFPSPGGRKNKVLGSISLNDSTCGFSMDSGGTTYTIVKNNTYQDDVAIGTKNGPAFGAYEPLNASYDGITSIGADASYTALFQSDCNSTTARNCLILNSSSGGGIGQTGGNWLIEHTNSYNNPSGNYDTSEPIDDNAGEIQRSMSIVATKMGTGYGQYMVFIPPGSNMKGAGKSGSDIGANILYRYENGVLTSNPLWNTVSGAFPYGAIVPGVNDISGCSLFDIHYRLHVNTNGCTLPPGYGTPLSRIEVAPATATMTSDRHNSSQRRHMMQAVIK